MTKRRHNRLARWVFRLGLAACIVIVVASVASFWWTFCVTAAGWVVGLNDGAVIVCRSIGGRARWSLSSIGPATPKLHEWLWSAQWIRYGTTFHFYPTWWFLLAALIPTLLAWRKQRRPYPPGHCRKCGYNLKGNVTGKCSECGTETEGDK